MGAAKVALVTGASTGLGRETCLQLARKGWTAVLTALTRAEAEAAVEALAAEDLEGEVVGYGPLDVTSREQALAAAIFVRDRFGRLDALVNNAAIIIEQDTPSALEVPPAAYVRTIANNAGGALTVAQAMVPLLREGEGGNLVNVSSGMGGLAGMGGTFAGYRTSKTALNALTRILHSELEGSGVRVNSVCPGHVKTPFGGPGATREVPEGAAGIVWAATLGPDGPSGGFFRDGEPIPW